MPSRIFAALVALVVFPGTLLGFEPEAVIQHVDAENHVVVVVARGQQYTVRVARDARFSDHQGKALANGLAAKEFKAGTTVTLLIEPDHTGPLVRAIRLGGKDGGLGHGGVGIAAGPPSVGRAKVGFKPLTEMTAQDKYKGEEGGLYGLGKNEPPEKHRHAAELITAQIVPLDSTGKPSADGKIVLVSISMSNATMEFSTFKKLADADPQKSSRLTIVDCAQGGQTMVRWADPNAPAWAEAQRRLEAESVTPEQVQIAWIKLANGRPSGELGDHGKKLERDTLEVLHNARAHFPNLQIAYLGSRIYGGYADGALNPEPYAYEGAFVVRWLIEGQIRGDAALNFDSQRGVPKSPLLLWGPYLWADGTTPRKSDGLSWVRDDLGRDGTHPSDSGRRKVAEQLLKFFKADPLAKTWFVEPGEPVKHLESLREYLDELRNLGEVQEIDAEVDWNLELGAIIRRSYELRAPAPLFNRIKGIEPGFRVLGAPAGVSGRRGLLLARVALSLGLPAASTGREIVDALAAAHDKRPVPPRRVATGPCKENKLLGEAVNLLRLPAPLIHDGDGGRYLNTWGTIVVRTPDERWTNWSITRIMVTGKNTMAGGVIPTQHLGIIYRQWKALGQPMPFALALGTEPAIPFVSGMPLDENVDEAGFLGGYLGSPVNVVDCETVPLQVPATSEIVIEGTLSPHETVHEGPMGEYSGYLMPGGGMPSPVFHVSAMTHRHDPILPVVAAGEPIEENHTCWGLTVSAQLLWELRRQGFPVSMCYVPLESAAHWLVVTVDRAAATGKTPDQLADDLAKILFGCRAGRYIPKIILVDDDVDPTNLDEVVWAFATRCHPETGHRCYPNEGMLPLVAFLSEGERKAARGTKLIYNCLSGDDRSPGQTLRRSSFRYAWPQEIQDKVVKNWQSYGFAKE